MSDPVRWSADANAPAEARELLRHAAAPTALDPETRARHAAAVAKIAAGATTAAAGAKLLGGSKLFGLSKAAGGSKLLLTLGLAGAVAVTAATTAVVRHRSNTRTETSATATTPSHRSTTATSTTRAPSPSQTAIDAPAPMAPSAPQETGATRPTVEPVTATSAHVAAPSSQVVAAHRATGGAPSVGAAPLSRGAPVAGGESHVAPAPTTPTAPEPAPTEDTLEREMRLLQGASPESDPRAALARAAEHERQFPRGQMAAEREFLAVQALRATGRDDEARARARALVARFPESPYASRVRSLTSTGP